MRNLALTFIIVSCLSISCSYNKEELIVEPVVPAVITYTSHIKAMVDNNCVSCHGSSGGVALHTYAQVKATADAGRILARAINGSGGGPMPQSGLMSQTNLDILQMWLDQGALQ
jgi:mono/diheme cytochrome c family protein